jgi:serine/threonine protein kinase
MRLEPGTLVADRYVVLEVLGNGGMGTVYRARHRDLDSQIAIKFLLPDLLDSKEARKRFLREGSCLARVKSEHVVRFHQFGFWHNTPFLVMEMVEGENLRTVMTASPLAWNDALSLGIEMSGAVSAAHAVGVVHRDLKPENFIVDKQTGKVKLIDFGLVHLDSNQTTDLTWKGQLIGSPHYMSPEACAGKEITTRSDIYSLGCIMFEMIAGHPPFEADSPIGLIHKHVHESTPKYDGSEAVPASFLSVISTCLEKVPDHRLTSEQLQATLISIAQDPNVELVSPSPNIREQGKIRVSGLATGMIMVVIFLLFVWARGKDVVVPNALDASSLADADLLSKLVQGKVAVDRAVEPRLRKLLNRIEEGNEKDARQICNAMEGILANSRFSDSTLMLKNSLLQMKFALLDHDKAAWEQGRRGAARLLKQIDLMPSERAKDLLQMALMELQAGDDEEAYRYALACVRDDSPAAISYMSSAASLIAFARTDYAVEATIEQIEKRKLELSSMANTLLRYKADHLRKTQPQIEGLVRDFPQAKEEDQEKVFQYLIHTGQWANGETLIDKLNLKGVAAADFLVLAAHACGRKKDYAGVSRFYRKALSHQQSTGVENWKVEVARQCAIADYDGGNYKGALEILDQYLPMVRRGFKGLHRDTPRDYERVRKLVQPLAATQK